MKLPRLPWTDPDEPQPSLLSDLRSGRAGAPLRLGLSVAGAGLLVAPIMFVLGLVEVTGGRAQEEHLALGLGLAATAWCGFLAWLWGSYRRWKRAIYTILAVLAIWAVTIPICALIVEATRRSEFLVAGCIFVAASLTIGVVATSAYRGRGGRSVRDRAGKVYVQCPTCKYSMVGLESCACPECGSSWTIDALIGAQDYAVFRRPTVETTGVEVVRDGLPAAETEGPEESPPRGLPEPVSQAAESRSLRRSRAG